MTIFQIAMHGVLVYLLLCLLPKRRSLEKKVRREENQLKRYGFRRIAGGYYILKSGATGIYIRAEAVATMKNHIKPRIEYNHEHTHTINRNTAESRHPSK